MKQWDGCFVTYKVHFLILAKLLQLQIITNITVAILQSKHQKSTPKTPQLDILFIRNLTFKIMCQSYIIHMVKLWLRISKYVRKRFRYHVAFHVTIRWIKYMCITYLRHMKLQADFHYFYKIYQTIYIKKNNVVTAKQC